MPFSHGMAIRMKEWGMLAYPRQSVHLPVNALNDWGRSGRALGEGIEQAGAGAAALAGALERVQAAGNEADISSALSRIGQETAEELMDLPVRDWDYSWRQAYQPRLREYLDTLSGRAREQAQELSDSFSALHSLEGRRKMELRKVSRARQQWQTQVEHAVEQGDTESALSWMEQGRGLFLPEEQFPQQLEAVQSRSLLRNWQHRLEQNPQLTLLAWDSDDSPKPAGENERHSLESALEQTRLTLRASLAARMTAAVEQGLEPDAVGLEQAAEAGVVDPRYLEQAKEPRHALAVDEACDWRRRIDEHTPDASDDLLVGLSLAPIPLEERRTLIRRTQTMSQIPQEQRLGMSRSLWSMYHDGYFGCPGDAEALRCLARLQAESETRLLSGTEKDQVAWLENLRRNQDDWVCYQMT